MKVVRKRTPPLVWTPELDARLLACREREKLDWKDIAALLKRSKPACQVRYGHLKARREGVGKVARMPERVPEPVGHSAGGTIVDDANAVLAREGYTARELQVMSLDARMRAANSLLKGWGLPQLGKNPNWLV